MPERETEQTPEQTPAYRLLVERRVRRSSQFERTERDERAENPDNPEPNHDL
jgi:hypothetical protein